jgi:hypothetical protein
MKHQTWRWTWGKPTDILTLSSHTADNTCRAPVVGQRIVGRTMKPKQTLWRAARCATLVLKRNYWKKPDCWNSKEEPTIDFDAFGNLTNEFLLAVCLTPLIYTDIIISVFHRNGMRIWILARMWFNFDLPLLSSVGSKPSNIVDSDHQLMTHTCTQDFFQDFQLGCCYRITGGAGQTWIHWETAVWEALQVCWGLTPANGGDLDKFVHACTYTHIYTHIGLRICSCSSTKLYFRILAVSLETFFVGQSSVILFVGG